MRARIVIVEDEPDLRDAVAEYLGAAGYDVATAETAAAARSLIETQAFHLAILDIAMRLRKKIEADPANPKFLRTVRGEGYIFSLPTGDSN